MCRQLLPRGQPYSCRDHVFLSCMLSSAIQACIRGFRTRAIFYTRLRRVGQLSETILIGNTHQSEFRTTHYFQPITLIQSQESKPNRTVSYSKTLISNFLSEMFYCGLLLWESISCPSASDTSC